MKKVALIIFSLILLFFGLASSSIFPATAQSNVVNESNIYFKAVVLRVKEEKSAETGYKSTLAVEIIEGENKGQNIDVNFERMGVIQDAQKPKQGETLILIRTKSGDSYEYFVNDIYRLDGVYFLIFITVAVTIIVAKLKGVTSVLGLVISILIIVRMILPGLQAGFNPILVGLVGSALIAIISMYLAHGINRRTSVSILATFITIAIALGLSVWAVEIAKLYGLGTEDAYYLQSNIYGRLNVRDLLLAGIIIGALGILDDITVSQVSIVEELNDTDKSLGFGTLFQRGLNVGKEHIASLINTLALAYVGVSLPLLLGFSINQSQPLWVLINSEFISEEIVRTLIGSITLILAVPISTFLAAYFIKYPNPLLQKLPSGNGHSHSHSHHHH